MGRHNEPAVCTRAHRFAAIAAALATLLLGPAPAAAHPLGNFTIDHYAEVRIESARVLLDVVIDQAEITAFQARQGFDLDADGVVSDEEIEGARSTACDELAPDLRSANAVFCKVAASNRASASHTGGAPCARLRRSCET